MFEFKDYAYIRPNLEELNKKIEKNLVILDDKYSFKKQIEAFEEIDRLTQDLYTYVTICSIRNSIDTRDEFYKKEQEFYDMELPKLTTVFQKMNKQLLKLKNRPRYEEKYGKLMFEQMELELKTFKPEIIPELQKENILTTKYDELKASAKISFDGKINNLSQMGVYLKSKDRKTRKEASLAISNFYKEKEKEFDDIYDKLVKTRTKIAKKLGYENFINLGYDRMGRLDYDHKMVKDYRKQIYEYICPVAKKLRKRQIKRLGIIDPKSYDYSLEFLSGNAKPAGDKNYLVNQAKIMYEEMSKETGEFFNFMLDHKLMDLEAKPGKRSGGYCTYIPKFKSPFIFSNFNGTSGDVDVLTHEAGHAFQVYSCRDLFSYYRWPSMEAAEIHSMSMEFFAWPWMKNFFGKDSEKYRFSHLDGAISFLPYGALVDEFQHYVYKDYNMSPEERKKVWRKLEKKYLPHKDYSDDPMLDKGTFWYRQGHIFSVPFYYIDYTLAQVIAFQFWILNNQSHEKAWNKYYKLCKLGGSKTFINLLKEVGLENPFKKGTIKKIVPSLIKYLDSIDDKKL